MKKYFYIKENIINPIVWWIIIYCVWVGKLSAFIPWGFVLRTQIHILDLNHSEYTSTAIETNPIVVFLCPIPPKSPLSHIYYWVLKNSFVFQGETNEWYFITSNGMVNLPFNRNNTTDSMCDWVATLVGSLVRTEPMSEVDFLFLIILFGMVVYCFNYIRNHKW